MSQQHPSTLGPSSAKSHGGTHFLPDTQVGLLPASKPAQYSIRWASSKFDKVEKTLLGPCLFVPKYVDVFLGSRHCLLLCQRCMIKVPLSCADRTTSCMWRPGNLRRWREPARIWVHVPVTHACTLSAVVAKGVQPPHDPSSAAC